MNKKIQKGDKVNNSGLLHSVKFSSNEMREMMNDTISKLEKRIIDILQSHNIKEIQFYPSGDEDEESYKIKEEQFYKTPIEGTGYDKDGVYFVKVTKIELKEKDGKVEIYPYGDSAGDVYTFGLFEGEHVELFILKLIWPSWNILKSV